MNKVSLCAERSRLTGQRVGGMLYTPLNTVRIAALSMLISMMASTAHGSDEGYHEWYMRGQVVAVSDDQVTICIGSADGAEVGQILDAYSMTYQGGMQEGHENFGRGHVGQVMIKSIVDEHFARAIVTSGEVEMYNVVELQRRIKTNE